MADNSGSKSPTPSTPIPATDVSPAIVRTLGLFFLLAIALFAYLMAEFWPVKVTATQVATTSQATTNGPEVRTAPSEEWLGEVKLFRVLSFSVPPEVRLIWLVVIAAALGSYVHTVTSFASYVGNRTLQRSWLWWYILRMPIGVALAMIFYFVIRGGLFSGGALAKDISPFGVAALSGMVGMFSKQATDKLREVFDDLFRTAPGKGDDLREDKLVGFRPLIDSIEPTSVEKGSAETSLLVRGQAFAEGCQVTINTSPRQTRVKSERELIATITAQDLSAAGTLEVAVRYPGPPETLSNTVQLSVREPGASEGSNTNDGR